MLPRRLPRAAEYLVAVASIAAATAGRWLLDSALGDHLPFAVFLVAVTFTAWCTRLGPSVFALLLGTWMADFFFVSPRFSWTFHLGGAASQVGLAIYLVVGIAIISVCEVSRRARWRAELRREELQITLNSIGDAVITTDSKGCVTSLNPVAESLTGWKQAEAVGRTLGEVFRIVNEQTREPIEDPVAKVLAAGMTVGLGNHTVLIARNDTETPVDDSAAPIRDAEGELFGVVLTFRDITPRRQAEAALQESHSRNAAVVKAAIDGIITIDHRGRIVEFNPAAEQIFGRRCEEVIGREMAEVIIPERLRERHRRGIAHYVATGEGPILDQHIELPALRSDDSEFPVELAITRINQQGPPLFTGYIRDISERKRTEEHQKFLSRASELFASSLDLDTTMKNIVTLAVPTLADWAVVDIASRESDQPYRRLAVVHVDPAKTELAMELQKKYPPDPSNDRILEAIRTGQSELVTEVTEEMLRAASRSEEHFQILEKVGIVSWMIVPLRMRDVPIGAVTFVSSDSKRRFTNTDLAHAEEFARRASTAFENSRLYSDAQQANRSKDSFLATLSHELRTPMTSILGWARMLGEGDLDDETYAMAVDSIQRGAKMEAQLIEDVLDMSRIASGKMRCDVRMCDLTEIAQAALATVEPAAMAKGIAIDFEKGGQILVTGDPSRLQQVIWNLLTNAVKFTPRGGRVHVDVKQVDSSAQVTVSDNGPGFAREFGVHMFEPFRQAENVTTRSHGGLGLGLSIVRHLVEQHGGVVTAESPGVDQGATFRVRIPLRALKVDQGEQGQGTIRLARESDGQVPCLKDELSNLHILLVDDQEDARTLFQTILQRCGARVALAQSVADGIEKFDGERFDVVVTDIAMPDRDGFEFIDWLNRRRNRSQFRIIALTAFGGPDDQEKVRAAGCDDYLKKPVEPVDLIAAIARVSEREPGLPSGRVDRG